MSRKQTTFDVIFVWVSRLIKAICLLIFLWHLFQKIRMILSFSDGDADSSSEDIDLRDGVLHGVEKLEHDEEERHHAK